MEANRTMNENDKKALDDMKRAERESPERGAMGVSIGLGAAATLTVSVAMGAFGYYEASGLIPCLAAGVAVGMAWRKRGGSLLMARRAKAERRAAERKMREEQVDAYMKRGKDD